MAVISFLFGCIVALDVGPAGFNHLHAGMAFAVCVICICLHYRRRKPIEFVEAVGTLSGIGLTFIGLMIALYNLKLGESADIRDSISGLLSGIYPAFFSSIAGIFMALTTSWFPHFWKMDESAEELSEDLDIDSKILRELQSINKGQVNLNESFEKFAEKMAENNMNALKEVIEKFNDKLQEQFGENFKKLNEAVKDLLEWQNNYKDIVESGSANLQKMQLTLESSNNVIQKTANEAIDKISSTVEQINESAKSSKEVYESLEKSLKQLYEAIENVSNMAGVLRKFSGDMESVPRKIEENMNKSTTKAVEDLGQNLKGISEALVRDYERVQVAINKIMEIHKDN